MAPSHYLNQCWNIVHWILRNTLQWNFNSNSIIFILKNMPSANWQPFCLSLCVKEKEIHDHLYCINEANWLCYISKCLDLEQNISQSSVNTHITNVFGGVPLNVRPSFQVYIFPGIPIIKIRRRETVIFIIWIPVLARRHHHIEMGPWGPSH